MKRTMAPTVVALLFWAAPSFAHHGYTAFFSPMERTFTVEGDIERIQYSNPHVVFTINGDDGTVYTVTWQSPAWLKRIAHVTPDTFAAGDHLVIVGAPARDPASHEVTMIREVRRGRDQWRWVSAAPFAKPSSLR